MKLVDIIQYLPCLAVSDICSNFSRAACWAFSALKWKKYSFNQTSLPNVFKNNYLFKLHYLNKSDRY